MSDIARQPKIVGKGAGSSAPYDLFLDSPLGYVLQAGGFETRDEIDEWLDEHYPDRDVTTPSLW